MIGVLREFLVNSPSSLLALLSVATLGLSPEVAIADSLSFAGVEFFVDRIEQIDNEHITVQLAGEAFLAKKEDAGRRVVHMYADKPELARRLPWSTYGPFIEHLATKDPELARRATRGVLQSSILDEAEVLQFLTAISSSKASVIGLLAELRQLPPQTGARASAACGALVFLGEDGRGEMRKTLVSEPSWIVKECPQKLIEQARQSFTRGDIEPGERILTAIVELFPEGEELRARADKALSTLRAAQAAARGGDPLKLEDSLRLLAFDSVAQEGTATLRPRLIAEFAQRQIIEGRGAAALEGLAQLDFLQRNSAHHELVSKALQRTSFKDAEVLRIERVQKMLWAYASKDDSIRRQYASLLVDFVVMCAAQKNVDLGTAMLRLLRDIRPDPFANGDSLRREIVERIGRATDSSTANLLLREIGDALPLWVRMRSWINRSTLMFLLGGLVLVVGGLGLRRILSRRAFSAQRRRQTAHESGERIGSEPRQDFDSAFGEHSLGKASYSDYDEYGECLAKFNLQVGATANEIKVAYRNMVKAYHPDINPHASKDTTDRFIELTKTYERLLVLHEEREKSAL